HGYVSRGGRLEAYYQADRWALRRLDHVIAVSEDLYRALPSLGVPSSRCSLVPNAIDTQQFTRRRSLRQAREHLGLDASHLVVGAVGRLAAEKGFDILIRATDLLLNAGLDVELWLIGDGDERSRLESLARELGHKHRILLLGHRLDVRELYEAMDVFALSSLREGLPNVLLEAMSLEVPVVATNVAGVPGLIKDGLNGLLIPPHSVEQLTQALARLLNDAALRDRLRQAGRQSIEARYSFAGRMDRVRALYDQVLS